MRGLARLTGVGPVRGLARLTGVSQVFSLMRGLARLTSYAHVELVLFFAQQLIVAKIST